MLFYRTNFNFQEPYNVLTDSEFVLEMENHNWDTKHMLSKLLGGVAHITFPLCIYKHLKQDSSTAKTLKKSTCKHQEVLAPEECIKAALGERNKDKLFIATQNKQLRKELRSLPGVPIIYFKKGIMTLDPPSQVSVQKAQRKELLKSQLTSSRDKPVRDMLKELKQNKEAKQPDKEKNKMKLELGTKRKAKGPNPLSCKKKQKVENPQPSAKKTRRKRKSNINN